MSDLGLARFVPHSTATTVKELEACVPVRWTAPEVLLRGEWSQVGVLCSLDFGGRLVENVGSVCHSSCIQLQALKQKEKRKV